MYSRTHFFITKLSELGHVCKKHCAYWLDAMLGLTRARNQQACLASNINLRDAFDEEALVVNRRWVLAETTDKEDKNNNLVLVEVELFNDESHSLEPHLCSMKNYTREGADPNLSITHLPPSNQLH